MCVCVCVCVSVSIKDISKGIETEAIFSKTEMYDDQNLIFL